MNSSQYFSSTNSGYKPFKPDRYWVSGAVQSELQNIRSMILTISPGLYSTPEFGGETCLNIMSVEEVVSFYGTCHYSVTPQYLSSIISHGLHSLALNTNARQRISMSLNEASIAITGVNQETFLSLYSKIVLTGGTPVHASDIAHMDMLASTSMLDPFAIRAASCDIPVVSPDLIMMCYASQQPQSIEQYQLHALTGITLCGSDLDEPTVSRMKDGIKACQGVWSDCLDQGVDFVIAERLCNTKKIRIAMQGNMGIVSPKWIDACMVKPTEPKDFTFNFWVNGERYDIFEGKVFAIDENCECRDLLIEAIRASGGRFRQNPDFTVVPNFYQKGKGNVTTQWVWNSISEKKMLPIEDSLAYQPFNFKDNDELKELRKKQFVVYKFKQEERFKVIDILRALGIVVRTRLSGKPDYIITPDFDTKCTRKEEKYGTKIVRPDWINELAKTGKVPTGLEKQDPKELETIISLLRNTRSQTPQSNGPSKSSSMQTIDFSDDEDPESNGNDIIYTPYVKTKKRKKDDLISLLENSK